MKFTITSLLFTALLSGFAAAPRIEFEEIQAKWAPLPLAQVKAAAEKGEVTAQHYLGRIHMEGKVVPRDTNTAVMWYEKAVAQDFPNSSLNLALWLMYGERGVGTDRKRGIQLLRKAAEHGAPNALYYYARALTFEGNPAEAAENYEKAANAGFAPAMVKLAELYTHGYIERDYAKAYFWLKKAADAGEVQAMVSLSEMLLFNYENVGARPEEAKQWREKAIAKGHRFETEEPAILTSIKRDQLAAENAVKQLAEADRLDQGEVADRRRAFQIYLEFAERNPKAAFKVAQAYEAGELVKQDDRKALHFYARSFGGENWPKVEAAILRLIEAGRGLGAPEENRLVVGSLQSRNYDRPPEIAYRIARMFEDGKIMPPDLAAATRLYHEAAISGSAEARNRLGELWLEGVNGRPDPEEAAKWFRSAAQAGYVPAQKNLERLSAK